MELPVTTTLLLRQVAAIAAEQGEDLADPLVGAECLKVFALGGRSARDDATETGYFAVRVALAEALRGAVGEGIAGTLLPGFVGAIAARFGGPVALKLSAQAAPVLGAAAGAAVNLAFLEHFRGMRRGPLHRPPARAAARRARGEARLRGDRPHPRRPLHGLNLGAEPGGRTGAGRGVGIARLAEGFPRRAGPAGQFAGCERYEPERMHRLVPGITTTPGVPHRATRPRPARPVECCLFRGTR